MPVLLGIPLLLRFLGFLLVTLFGYLLTFLKKGFGKIAIAISLFLALIMGLTQFLWVISLILALNYPLTLFRVFS